MPYFEWVKMKVLVCGGREFQDYAAVCSVLERYEISLIIHGDARGADSLAKRYAIERGIPHLPFPADWQTHGRAAGPIRNKEMLRQNPDIVIAFPGGRGTDNMCKQAVLANMKVVRV